MFRIFQQYTHKSLSSLVVDDLPPDQLVADDTASDLDSDEILDIKEEDFDGSGLLGNSPILAAAMSGSKSHQIQKESTAASGLYKVSKTLLFAFRGGHYPFSHSETYT